MRDPTDKVKLSVKGVKHTYTYTYTYTYTCNPTALATHAPSAPALRPICTYLHPSAFSICRHVPETAAETYAAYLFHKYAVWAGLK